MGLLGSKKKTYVSSVVYNMAGDIKDRPDYLKTLITSRILEGKRNKLSTDLIKSYIDGPGIDLRRFGRWARLYGYNQNVGIVQSSVAVPKAIDFSMVARNMEQILGTPIYIIDADVGPADYGMWASQYMLENRKKDYPSQWVADYSEDTNTIKITIGLDDIVTFTPNNFSVNSQYLYVSFNPLVPAPSTPLTWSEYKPQPAPSTDGYTKISETTSSNTLDLTQTVTVTQTITGQNPVVKVFDNLLKTNYKQTTAIYSKTEELPDADKTLITGHITKYIEIRNNYTLGSITKKTSLNEDLGNGITRTTVTETVEQTYNPINEYRTGQEKIVNKAWGDEDIFIYRRGSGNSELDSVFQGTTSAGEFFPSIPLRIDNKFVTEENFPIIYPWVNKAIRKSTNTTITDLIEQIGDNPSIGDIDYAYVVFGVSLNTSENTAKRYLYEFFKSIGLNGGTSALDNYWTEYEAAMDSWSKWNVWYDNSRKPGGSVTTEPVRKPLPVLPVTSINIKSSQNYDMTINFSGMTETVYSGVYKPGAKINDITISQGDSKWIYAYSSSGDSSAVGGWGKFISGQVNQIDITWQYAQNSYRKLTISNLTHKNNIYGGKSVDITALDALKDPEESGFIIPLHEGILRSLPIPVVTQMSTASTYLVFNCYQVVKQKWYQTGLFKVVLVIITIVIAVYSGYTDPTAGGLLGSNAAVGTSIGFTGTAAIVAGAIANAVVAMVVVQMVSRGARAVFGDKVGSVVGAIASLVAINVGTSMAGGQGIAASFGNMMSAKNIMLMASSIGNGIAGYIQASALETQQQTQSILQDYQEQAKSISEKYLNEFGTTGMIDPLASTNTFNHNLEDPNLFLDRTLMTGTDVANISMEMLENFVDMTISTNLD